MISCYFVDHRSWQRSRSLISTWPASGGVMDSAGLDQYYDTVAPRCFPSWPWLAVWLFENLSAHLAVRLKQFRSPYTFIKVLLIDSFAAVPTQSGNVEFQLSLCDLPLSEKNVIYSTGNLKVCREKTKKIWNIDSSSVRSIKRCFWPCEHKIKIAGNLFDLQLRSNQSWITK